MWTWGLREVCRTRATFSAYSFLSQRLFGTPVHNHPGDGRRSTMFDCHLYFDRLGLGLEVSCSVPQRVRGQLQALRVVEISAGNAHTVTCDNIALLACETSFDLRNLPGLPNFGWELLWLG